MFYDNNCFYISEDGTVFLYGSEMNDPHQYDRKLKPGMRSVMILKTDIFVNLAKEFSEKWFGEFCDSLVKNPEKEIFDRDTISLMNYLKIKNTDMGQNTYQDIKTWKKTYFDVKYSAFKGKEKELAEEFRRKWNIQPSEGLFPSGINLSNISLVNARAININQYRGKKNETNFLFRYHNKLIEVYQKIRTTMSNGTRAVLESNYSVIRDELNKSVGAEKKEFDDAVTDHNNKTSEINSEFKQNIRENLASLQFIDSNLSGDFGYLFLPPQGSGGSYTLVYKKTGNQNESLGFRQLGQDTKVIGIHDKYIYTCEDGGLVFFDPFTLEKIDGPRNIAKGNEKIVFIVDQERGVVITNTPKGTKNDFAVKSISFDKNNGFVLEKVESIQLRDKNIGFRTFDAPFYCETIDPKDNGVYINSLESKAKESITVEGGYIYRETSAGSGIRRQRR